MLPDWLLGALRGMSGKTRNGAGGVEQMEPSGGFGMDGGGVTKSVNPKLPASAARNYTDPLMDDKSWLNKNPKDIKTDFMGFFSLFGR